MDLKKLVQEEHDKAAAIGCGFYGGVSLETAFRQTFNDITRVLSGYDPIIKINYDELSPASMMCINTVGGGVVSYGVPNAHERYAKNNVTCKCFIFPFNIKGGGEYQYNKMYVDSETCELVYVDGDGGTMVKRIFDLIKELPENFYEKYNDLSGYIYHILYYKSCDELYEMGYNKYIRVNEPTIKKIMRLNSLHGKLLSLPVDEMLMKLEELDKLWERDNFKIVQCGGISHYFEGEFSSNTTPNIFKGVPNPRIICFPDNDRSSVCKNFLLATNLEQGLKVGEKIVLKKKNKEIIKYNVVDINSCGFYAISEIGKRKVEFLTHFNIADEAYDALYPINKRSHRGYKTRVVELITEQ